ncbi:methyltransferase domain-containing protein [Caldibacillus lycopersici]|uniref:Methyltransferase domain-containing protein n=1 Tax=Perspicuibacillus lycopersici TaxID=1325689 RepID=A0AAE3ITE3_9BACI|nr:class I SAM-dependent methyltransferase [Perspicuibacillus lycopersici]MCU9614270.1 methyltransferase domain-containing protein [Perspicuibacillus lycopersici]
MRLEKVLPYSHKLLSNAIKAGDIVVDATIGNGNDTLFLAQLVGEEGIVYGFDVQKQAIKRTNERLQQHGVSKQVILFHAGHEQLKEKIPIEQQKKISAAIFNLGYLPSGDHSIVTLPVTTISAIEQLLENIAPGGIIVLVIYHGHPEGKVEKDAILEYVKTIDQAQANVLLYQFINQKNNPPFIIAIEKR